MSTTPEILEFAAQLAEALPPWEVDLEYDGGYAQRVRLVNTQVAGAELYLRFDKDRVAVYGGYVDRYGPSYEMEPKMTVSVKREVADIAKEIRRRFMERYMELFAASVEQAYQAGMGKAKAQELADELAIILGDKPHEQGNGWFVWAKCCTFRVEPGSEQAHIAMDHLYSVEVDLALELARVIARWEAEHGNHDH